MDKISEAVIEALLTPPRYDPGEVPQGDEWSDKPYKSGTMTGSEQEAAIYLGHVRTGDGWFPGSPWNKSMDKPARTSHCWWITRALQRAINHDPELIVMSARMKKWMAE